jgi:hypothetical protein
MDISPNIMDTEKLKKSVEIMLKISQLLCWLLPCELSLMLIKIEMKENKNISLVEKYSKPEI